MPTSSTGCYGAIGRSHAAYFDMINEQGGINGRQIEFITLDDGYSPPKTVEQVRRLVEKEQVLLLFGLSGTPTNTAVHRYINAKKMPHLFLLTRRVEVGAARKNSRGRWDGSRPIRSKPRSTPNTFWKT